MRKLKTYCATAALLLALSVNSYAGDMSCGYEPPLPPPPPTTESSISSTTDTPSSEYGQQNSNGLVEESWIESIINLLFGSVTFG